MNGKSTQETLGRAPLHDGAKQGISPRAEGQASSRKVSRLQAGHPGDGTGSPMSKVRRGARGASLLQLRGPSRSHHGREPVRDAGGDAERELIFRENYVRIEPLPDDFRGCPVDWNLRQHLVIPDVAREPSRLGKILALGTGVMQNGERWQFSLQVGDIVLTNRYPKSCQNFKWGFETVIVLREDEILAKVDYAL